MCQSVNEESFLYILKSAFPATSTFFTVNSHIAQNVQIPCKPMRQYLDNS